jgi:hypothetical protein
MFSPRILIFVALTFGATHSFGQRDIQVTLPFHFHIGAALARADQDSIAQWAQGLGNSISLYSGLGLKYKNSYGIDLLGNVNLTSYSFQKGDSSYSISNTAAGLGLFPYFNILLKKEKKNYLQLGCTMGQLFQKGDQHQRPYFIPSISITGFRPRSSFSVGLNYAIFENEQPLLRTTIQQSNGQKDIYAGSGNYLGLQMRYSLTIAGHLEPKHKTVPPLANAELYYQRNYKIEKEFVTPSKNVTLLVYDNGEVDNDTISVLVNGEYVLTHFPLTKKKKKIKLRLNEFDNEILFIAENEGRVPPNTAHCELRSRLRKSVILVSTEDDQNVSIPIWVGPDGHVQNE